MQTVSTENTLAPVTNDTCVVIRHAISWAHVVPVWKYFLQKNVAGVLHHTYAQRQRGYTQLAWHIGKYDTLLQIIKNMKDKWFGHVVRAKGTLTNITLQGKVEEDEITRKVSKKVVWQCKRIGMATAGLDRDVEGPKWPCGLKKACQSYCPQRTEWYYKSQYQHHDIISYGIRLEHHVWALLRLFTMKSATYCTHISSRRRRLWP